MAGSERLAPGVYRVDAIGIPNAINVLLLESEGGWTLVDTGLASSVERIQRAMADLGAGLEKLSLIFLTHQHNDHTGGLPGLLEGAPHARVGASPHEAEVISGRRRMDPQTNPVLRFLARNATLPPVTVTKVLREGDLVSGFRVIATPGHTRGHVSLLRDSDGLLFTADAFGCLPRRIRVGVRRALCNDPAEARRSAEKLLRRDFATAVMSHGPVVRAGARAKLQDVVARCRY